MICALRQKRGGYIWVPQNLITEQVHKEHTKLNMWTVFGEQIMGGSSKQTKLNFWNRLYPKTAFLCRFLTQTATWWAKRKILSSNVIAFLKVMTDAIFLGPSLGGSIFFIYGGFFFNKREYSGADWMVPLFAKSDRVSSYLQNMLLWQVFMAEGLNSRKTALGVTWSWQLVLLKQLYFEH